MHVIISRVSIKNKVKECVTNKQIKVGHRIIKNSW